MLSGLQNFIEEALNADDCLQSILRKLKKTEGILGLVGILIQSRLQNKIGKQNISKQGKI